MFIYQFKKIKLTKEQIRTSTSNETRHQAIDGNPESYWHVKFPKEETDVLIEIDLSEKTGVNAIRVLPRIGHTDQMWFGQSAFWESSNDGHNWQLIDVLKTGVLKDKEWVNFILQDERTIFRYYRLRIRHPNFLSFAEIELYHR